MTAERKLHRIRGWAKLIGAVQTKGNGHGHGRLHDQTLAAIIQVGRLCTALKGTKSRDGDALAVKSGWVNNVGHDGL